MGSALILGVNVYRVRMPLHQLGCAYWWVSTGVEIKRMRWWLHIWMGPGLASCGLLQMGGEQWWGAGEDGGAFMSLREHWQQQGILLIFNDAICVPPPFYLINTISHRQRFQLKYLDTELT